MSEWILIPGQRTKRTDLHRQFGGSRYGGISPSRQSPNIFIFTDPASGEQHGYIDYWKDDGCFHYTGEGQRGDKKMVKGNLAIRDCEKDGRVLRLFYGTGGEIEYRGTFMLDPERPCYRADAPETGGGPIRSVIVFRLRPIDTTPAEPKGLPAVDAETSVLSVPVEERNTERCVVDPPAGLGLMPSRGPRNVVRTESGSLPCCPCTRSNDERSRSASHYAIQLAALSSICSKTRRRDLVSVLRFTPTRVGIPPWSTKK